MNDNGTCKGGLTGAVRCVIGWMEHVPYALIALMARIIPAIVFFKSGQTKVEGPVVEILGYAYTLPTSMNDSAYVLFADEYRVPLIPPDIAAVMAATAEHLLSVLLVIGLASRFSALGLLGMTAVIQIFVYPDAYLEHGFWAIAFLVIIARGPGVISLDHMIRRAFGCKPGCSCGCGCSCETCRG